MIGARQDQGGLVGLGLRLVDGRADCVGVHAIDRHACASRAASKRAATSSRQGDVGGAGQGDVVLVVEVDQLAETEVAGERGGLHGDAFHHVAVGDDAVGVVVDDLVAGAVEAWRPGNARRWPCRRRWQSPDRADRW